MRFQRRSFSPGNAPSKPTVSPVCAALVSCNTVAALGRQAADGGADRYLSSGAVAVAGPSASRRSPPAANP
jgi:hypothetical protein